MGQFPQWVSLKGAQWCFWGSDQRCFTASERPPYDSRMSVRALIGSLAVYSVAGAAILVGERRGELHQPLAQAASGTSRPGERWFAEIRGRCNPLEVTSALRDHPPPADVTGAAYAAACWAFAGKLDLARREINKLPAGEARVYAASVVFYVAHPVADHGDDVAAGPIMELVLEFKPDDFQALYHAGMSEYALGRTAQAEQNLRQFRQLYRAKDFFGNNADQALDRIQKGLPPLVASPGAHE